MSHELGPFNSMPLSGSRAVWGPCPGCGRWQVCVADEVTGGNQVLLSERQIVAFVDEAFRDHARAECPGLAELIAVRGMSAKPAPRIF